MTTLYNLHTDGDLYRVTKFVDGEPESSYVLNHDDCQCPAGHRSSCRHRQMLPLMLSHNLLNAPWFWDFDRQRATDFNGLPAPQTIIFDEVTSVDPEWFKPAIGEPSTQPASWRRI